MTKIDSKMDERYFNYTSCIKAKNLDAIAAAITNLIIQEQNFEPILRLPKLTFDPKQLAKIKMKDRPKLCVVGLFCGEEDWTIIKTYPKELLCKRNTNSDCPRLSELAMNLGCDSFHYRAVRDLDGILMAADSSGRIFVSGSNDHEGVYDIDEQDKFYQEQINESMKTAMLVNEDPASSEDDSEF
jgi:hypothetical protein